MSREWWRRLLPWDRRDDELREELQSHLEMATRDKVASGLSRREAEAAARRELGNELLVREVTRETWGWGWLERLLQDLRYGARLLRRSPGYTAAAVLTLALGVGANTAVFSVANATLLQSLPFPEPERLMLVWEGRRDEPQSQSLVSVPTLRDWQERSRSFERLEAFDSGGRGYNLSRGGERELVVGSRVTAGFFEALGVAPMLGRSFAGEEEVFGPNRLVVLSHGLWQRAFGADASVVGDTVHIDGEAHTVLGVMPPEFRFQLWGRRELWVLAGFTENDRSRGAHSWIGVARLAEQATLESARAEMEALGAALADEHPEALAGATVRVVPAGEWGLDSLRATFRALVAIVGLVLLIACANVANLSLARGTARRHELRTRHALGAGGGRLARQLLTESLLLAALGGAAGLIVAAGLMQFLPDLLPGSLRSVPLRPAPDFRVDARVLTYTLGLTTLAGIVFGTAPALLASRRKGLAELMASARGASPSPTAARLRGALVVAEVALSLVVLAGAGLMLATMRQLLAVDPGLDPDGVLVTFVSLPQEETFVGPPALERFCADLSEHVGAVPGVISVGAIGHLPLTGSNAGRSFVIEGRPLPAPEEVPGASYSVACPGALRTLGVPLVAGREFDSRDVLGVPDVVIVNQTLAERHWPGESVVGRRFRLAGPDDEQPWLTVVGVFRDIRHWGLSQPIDAAFLRPYQQAAWPGMAILARTRPGLAPRSLEQPIEAALERAAPDSPAAFVTTMREVADGAVGPWRFPLVALSAFAAVALVLAAVGVAGVIGYSVSQRSREIGVRVSLGARPGDIRRLVVGSGLTYAALGSALGLFGSAALLRLMDSLLFGVTAGDPLVLGGAALLLFLTASGASLLPARQATRVDPVVALRSE